MVGTRHVYACLAVCVLTADATQVSVAATPARAFHNNPAAAMLVAYQLRRKHRALRAQPFSP